MAIPLLTVKVQTPQTILFQGRAQSVSSTNSLGEFDILPKHANFITLIENKTIVVVTEDKKAQQFQFKEAIILNNNNTVTIFAEPES